MIAETLHRAGQLDPESLLSLPEDWQRLHLSHTYNHMVGRYDPQPRGRGNSPEDHARAMAAAERFRKHRENGPPPEDIRAAEALLAMVAEGRTVPQPLIDSAHHTLTLAGRM